MNMMQSKYHSNKRESNQENFTQHKFKKWNDLKHNPKPAAKATDFQEDNENWVQSSSYCSCPTKKSKFNKYQL